MCIIFFLVQKENEDYVTTTKELSELLLNYISTTNLWLAISLGFFTVTILSIAILTNQHRLSIWGIHNFSWVVFLCGCSCFVIFSCVTMYYSLCDMVSSMDSVLLGANYDPSEATPFMYRIPDLMQQLMWLFAFIIYIDLYLTYMLHIAVACNWWRLTWRASYPHYFKAYGYIFFLVMIHDSILWFLWCARSWSLLDTLMYLSIVILCAFTITFIVCMCF